MRARFVSTYSTAEIRRVFNNVFKFIQGFSSSLFLEEISLASALSVNNVCAFRLVSTISPSKIGRVFNNVFKMRQASLPALFSEQLVRHAL